MNDAHITSDELGAFVSGALDVIFALTIVLERRGLLTRAEIVDTLAEVQDQIAGQDGPQRLARGTVVELMRKAFNLPMAGDQVRARWEVINGGQLP